MAAMSAKQWLQRGVPVVISIASISWLLGSIDTEALMGALNWRIAAILLPALLLYGALSLVLEAVSIWTLVDRRPPGFGLWICARIKSASYLVGIVNYALGGVALTVLLRKRADTSIGESAGIVLLNAQPFRLPRLGWPQASNTLTNGITSILDFSTSASSALKSSIEYSMSVSGFSTR